MSDNDSRSNPVLTITFLLVMAGMGLGVYTFLQWHGQQESMSEPSGHVDFEQPPDEGPAAPQQGQTNPAQPSSLTMIHGTAGNNARYRPMGAARSAGGNPAVEFTQAVRKNEPRFASLAQRYTNRFPIIREYGRDWMKYPDLKRFNDEYFQDHDPIKFAKNVAGSPNFAALVRKYAGRPEIMAFVEDAVKIAPRELSESVQNYLKVDANATKLLERFAASLGLPSIWVAAISGKQNISPNQAVNDVIKSNPQIQGLMQNGNLDPNQINSQMQGR